MLKNYLKIALRSIWRNKFHAIVNVAGLGLAIACCLLIGLYLRDEWTFDTFHPNAKSIYRAYVKEDYGENQIFFNTVTPYPLATTLKENFPELKHVTRVKPLAVQVKSGANQFDESVVIVDRDFFKMFNFTLSQGNSENIFDDPTHLVITKTMATKYFGDRDPINQVLSIAIADNFESFIVKAVANDPPLNSSIRFDFLISSLNLPKVVRQASLTSGWFNVSPETYVELKSGVDANALVGKFPSVFRTVVGEDFDKSKYFVGLQPLTDIHLNKDFPEGIAPVSDPQYANVLAGISLLVLVVACINFITLSVGRTFKRAKEVGIRKVVGAVRKQLIFQFIGEAVMITLISLMVGLAIAGMSLPVFNDLSGKLLTLAPDTFTLITSGCLVILIGLFAGSYPAFVLSNFRPITILKGAVQGNSRQALRKVLVGIQLVLSIFLVSSALTMKKQLNFLQTKDLGFNRDQVAVMQLNVPSTGRLHEQMKAGFEKAALFKAELMKKKSVANVWAASHDFANGRWTGVGYTDETGLYREFYVNVVDADYLPAMEMTITEGRNFNSTGDQSRAVIVNEAFAKEYGWENPLGQRLPGKNFVDHEVIGVVKDFHFASLYTEIQPLMIVMDAMIPLSGIENFNIENSPIPKVMVRLHAGYITDGIKDMEAVWKTLAGNEEFSFSFIDDRMNDQYRQDQNLSRIIDIATILSVIIGSLGLYALASLSMQSRIKEISIRKVLGATSRSLLMLLSRDFMFLILLSALISIPLTAYFMLRWLENFEYHINLQWTVFVLAGCLSILTGLLSIGYEAVRTARSQPAETLKNE